MNLEAARRAAAQFAFQGALADIAPLESGYINETYQLRMAAPPGASTADNPPAPSGYVLQCINTAIFTDPPKLMENITRVTRHIAMKQEASGVAEPQRRALNLIPTRTAGLFWLDDCGRAWRAFDYIAGTMARQVVTRPGEAEAVGRAFAAFQAQLIDLPAPPLHEILPGFHDTPTRLAALRAATNADQCGRAPGCAAELLAIERHAGLAQALAEPWRSGRLPTRVVHNDAKINNVLFDALTGEVLCIVDLDTVMPGLALHDFGDMVRSMACVAAEDETDLSRLVIRHDILAALTRGYLSAAQAFLTSEEIVKLPLSGAVITFEQAVRFLTDHLRGDVYYRVSRPDHNLDRARNQLALLEGLLETIGNAAT